MKATIFKLTFVSLFLASCTSSPDKVLLPDSGHTTEEIMQGERDDYSYYGDGQKRPFQGQALMSNYHSASQYSSEHIRELKRDFKRVPNPEIIGYVYPHINNNEMPIPGYFTTFLLYDRSHYALSSEGYNE